MRGRAARLGALAGAALAHAPATHAGAEPAPAWAPPAFTIRDVPAPGSGVAAPAALPEAPAVSWAPPAFAVRDAPGPGSGVTAPAAPPEAEDGGEDPRARAVDAARRLLGRPYRSDCSGFVLEAWRAAGIRPRLAPARSRSESLYQATRRVEAPLPGDLAFFHDTYDRNRDGRANDRFSHVALVEAVEGEAVTLVHRGVGGIERIRMDLGRPSDPALNDRVRVPRRGDPRKLRLLAGELFAGYGALPSARGVAAAR